MSGVPVAAMRSCTSQDGVGWTWWSNHPILPIPTSPSTASVSGHCIPEACSSLLYPSQHSILAPLKLQPFRHSSLNSLALWSAEDDLASTVSGCLGVPVPASAAPAWRLDGGGGVSFVWGCASVGSHNDLAY